MTTTRGAPTIDTVVKCLSRSSDRFKRKGRPFRAKVLFAFEGEGDPGVDGILETSLHKSPFWILGASLRDDRQRIVERADERALELDPDVCQKARSELTNPRTRLTAEIGWLPGI